MTCKGKSIDKLMTCTRNGSGPKQTSVLSAQVHNPVRQDTSCYTEETCSKVGRSAKLTPQGILSAFYHPVIIHAC